jgi:hypothetical protein
MSVHLSGYFISESAKKNSDQVRYEGPTITFLDIIHRLVSCLKCRPVYISKHNFSETGFYLRPHVKPTQLGTIDRARWVSIRVLKRSIKPISNPYPF